MMTLANLESISIRTVYDNHMVSAALSDVVMDTTTVEFSILGHAKNVEECRWGPGGGGVHTQSRHGGFSGLNPFQMSSRLLGPVLSDLLPRLREGPRRLLPGHLCRLQL